MKTDQKSELDFCGEEMKMQYEDILYGKKDHVARITINRPQAGNMFRTKTLHEMKDALEG